MTEQDEQRPLTRRELRLREMGETGALDLSEVQAVEQDAPAPAAQPDAQLPEIEISPLHEDGTPRSRREMRQLREEALAAQAAKAAPVEATPAEAAPAEAAPAEAAPVEAAPAEAAPAGNAPAEAAPTEAAPSAAPELDEPAAPLTGEIDFDSLISPPTEPFTVDELRQAEQPADAATPADGEERDTAANTEVVAPAETPAEAAVETPAEETADAADVAEASTPAKPKRRFPWKKNRADDETAIEAGADAETDAPAEANAAADVPAEDPAPEAPAEAAPTEVITGIVVDEEPGDAGPETIEVRPEPATAATPVPDVVVPSDDAPEALPVAPAAEAPVAVPTAEPAPAEPVSAKPAYSFPDIAPPEEWRSVFDDPATRTQPGTAGAEAGGDFDDLISRAVAQEGATASSNTSALILPAMPEDTGGLTGPLGGTGDLYVTGSLKLPKSLGETGGHSSLHDSIEFDPITGAATEDPQTTGQGPAPVSARHAVSARMDSSIPVVAKPAKERSKLPLVLSLTGGGLLVAVVALGVWGASNGMFG